MYGPFPENPEEAIAILMDTQDEPLDCHRHCSHWDTEGECCGCGDVRTPNHSYIPPGPEEDEEASYEIIPR